MARVYERAAYEAALIAGNMPEMDEGAEKVLAAVRELAAEHREILEAVRAGDPAAFQRALDQAGAVARWHPVDTTATLRRHLQAWAETLARTLTAAAIDTPVAATDAETLRQRLALGDGVPC